MIVVTGASGHIGTALIKAIGGKERIRAVTRSRFVPGLAATETWRLDLARGDVPTGLFSGARAMFLFPVPGLHENVLKAAVENGVRYIVVMSSASVTHADVENNPIAARHARVERLVRNSGIPYTVVRPYSLAVNALRWKTSIRQQRCVRLVYPDARSCPLHEADVGEAIAFLLATESHCDEVIHLSGFEDLTYRTQVGVISNELDMTVEVVQVDWQQGVELLAKSMPKESAVKLLGFEQASISRLPYFTSAVLDLTGHVPRTFQQWVADHRYEFV